MRMIYSRRWWSFLLAATMSSQATAQELQIPTARLQSTSDTTRENAFYDMIRTVSQGQPARSGWSGPRTDLLITRAKQQPELALALITLLERENAVLAKSWPKAPPAPWDGETYYPDLFLTVAGLHDSRAIPALIPTIGLGSAVRSQIVALGETAVPAIVQALTNRDWATRLGAARALGELVAQQPAHALSDDATQTIRDALLRTVNSKDDFHVRTAAIKALTPFSGDDIRAVMKRIGDTATTRPSPAVAADPVRAAAQEWLQKHPTSR